MLTAIMSCPFAEVSSFHFKIPVDNQVNYNVKAILSSYILEF